MLNKWLRENLDPAAAPAATETRRVLRRSRRVWLTVGPWVRRIAVWGGAVAVAAAAILFAMGSEQANSLFLRLVSISPYLPLVVTPIGLGLTVAITRRFFPGTQGSGIPQTIAALSMREGETVSRVLSLRIAAGKMLLTLLALGSGASIGREGPTVQIGASIMHAVGRLLRLPDRHVQRSLILAGGAAGVAAAFNTPLAGIVFAIEEMSRSFESRASGTILTAVIFAGIASLAVLGNYTYFGRTSAALVTDESWIAVVICGVGAGLLGGLFARALLAASGGLTGRIGQFARARPVAFGAVCGLVLALTGLASGGHTYGTGYHEARALLEGEALPELYAPLKMFATVVSYASGVPGGIFAPSLATGAGVGAIIAEFTPYAPAAAVVLLGMVAYFAGVVQAPITAFVIVMEMTDNHEMVLPLMAAALIAHGTSRLVCRHALYRALAESFLQGSESIRLEGSTTMPPTAAQPRSSDAGPH
jgi:H+/Cl- antiporter ClcA